jgi:microcystin-dependent protein
MSDQFLGEIRIFGFNFAPNGWALCQGQVMPINQNTALFSLLGTMYGGNGTTTFALPNLQNSAPLNFGQGPGLSNYDIGESLGETAVTLLQSEMPNHTHQAACNSGTGDQTSPQNNYWAPARIGRQFDNRYALSAGSGAIMSAAALPVMGSSFPHNNMPPYLTFNFCIALVGIYPSRS